MIVKKIATSKTAAPKSKALHVRDLADYIAGPEAGGDGEKVEHRGSANLLNLSHDGQVEEIIDLAEMARRAPQPVQHWILSWREGEQPSPAQADEAVRLFLAEMGMERHQALYALHSDTDNWHLHLAVNRVDPDTEKVVTVNNGFDIDVAHRALAKIEHVQGWQREANGLYIQNADSIERTRPKEDGARQPSTGARDFEERSGQQSAERIAIERAAPIIRQAPNWRELHERLAAQGFRFEKKGSGALIWVADLAVKASAAGRDCSMAALQKRLGDFEPAPPAPAGPPRPAPLERAPAPLRVGAPAWPEYSAARVAHEAQRQRKGGELADRGRAEWRALAERHRRERGDIFRGSWKGKGDLLNAARSVLAARQAQEKLELRDRSKRERLALRSDLPRFPNYDQWLKARSPTLADQWRHRERRPAVIEGPAFVTPPAQDIRAFSALVDGARVLYHRSGERASPAFADRGKEIDIFDSRSRDAVLASLQLSAQKWGTFVVRGDETFKRLCVELAAEHGLKLGNPELQHALALERERRALVELARRGQRQVEAPPIRSNVEAYRRHYDQVGELPGVGDVSRRDALVAVRMRLTGHSRSVIEKAIREGAPQLRPNELRDWGEYAQRAAGFAWGVPGDRQAQQFAPNRAALLALEGRGKDLEDLRGLGGPLGRG